MTRKWARFGPGGRAIVCSLAISASALVAVGKAQAWPGFEFRAPTSLRSVAEAGSPASKEAAREFLARALPLATTRNPKYRSPGSEVETQWITTTVSFRIGPDSKGSRVSMSEDVVEFRNGARTLAAHHEVEFALDDVNVAERSDSGDTTETGERAVGIIFNCRAGKCIQSTYNGDRSEVDWSDIYIQDISLREEILQSFQTLTAGGR